MSSVACVRERWSSQFLNARGTFGHPIHAWLAAMWCVGCTGPTASVELLGLPLYAAALLRLPHVWRAARDAMTQPVLVCMLSWWGWTALSLLWTGNTAGGRHELEYIRWAPVVMTLWAVLDRRTLLIGALCVGFALAQVAQFAEWIALRQGLTLFSHPTAPDPLARISGWWHQPAAGGAMLCVAVGLHVGPAMFAHGRTRVWAIVGLVTSLAGVLATGTRGAMLASAAVVFLGCCVRLVHAIRGTRGRSFALMLLAASAILAGLILFTPIGASVRGRVVLAQQELSRAFEARDYDSDMGGRVVAARAALDMALHRPMIGHGAGSFLDGTRAMVERDGLEIAPWRVDKLRTAHNAYLHTVSTTGVVGLCLLLLTLACGLWGASVEVRIRGLASLGMYASAPLGGLVALAIGACCETVHLNMSTAALGSTLLALCPWHRFDEASAVRESGPGGT